MPSFLRRHQQFFIVPALILGGGLLGRAYTWYQARNAPAVVPEVAAVQELAQRARRGESIDPKEFERLALRLRALEVAAAEAKSQPAAAAAAAPVNAAPAAAEETTTPTPEEWYEKEIADKPYDATRTRAMQAAAATLLSRPTLSGLQLTESECFGEFCALRFQGRAVSDLTALQTELAAQTPFLDTTLLFSSDKEALSASIHLEPARSVTYASAE